VAAPRPRPRIGIAWQGNALHPRDGRRSIPLAAFAPVVRAWAGRAAFISLQKGPANDAIAAAALPLIDFGVDLDGDYDAFVDTAAVMAALDLVITSDTAVAHLAAALGVPVWVVLARPCDWRWGREGDRSAFYSTARLIRQRHPGDWSGAMDELAIALQGWAPAERRTA
jgi:ADP-heptose:LPS heptosyltransferase